MTVSTTTIVIPELKNQSHSFTLQNISIGDDVYSKITTSSSLFQKTIPVSPNWRHFKENAIPAKLADIAVAGPILDNSLLFSQSGKYISFVGKKRINLKGRPVDVYDFTLSGAEKNVPLALDSLMKRIGAEGHITIFIDFETKSALFFTLGNSSYHSTTTLISLDTPLSITPPILN